MRMKCIKGDCKFYSCASIEKKNLEMCTLDYGYCVFCGIDDKMDDVRDKILELENKQSELRIERQKIYKNHIQDIIDKCGGVNKNEVSTSK